jgi:hypothetical protein
MALKPVKDSEYKKLYISLIPEKIDDENEMMMGVFIASTHRPKKSKKKSKKK